MKAFKLLWIGILSISLLAFSFQTASAEPITVVSWGGSYGKHRIVHSSRTHPIIRGLPSTVNREPA